MQPEHTRPLHLVVLNNDGETLKTIAHWFEINGHRVTTSALAAMRRADMEEIADFLRRHNPDVIVYDVAMPYAPNWDYLTVLRTTPGMPRIPYVATTPNKLALQGLVGPNDADAFGFKWDRRGRSSKHIRFDWSGPDSA